MTRFILSAAETARAENIAAAAGVSKTAMMERAGEGVAEIARRFWERRPVAVMCGPGNNGGDGFVAARHLADAGWTVRLGLLGDQSSLAGDAKLMAGLYRGAVEPLTEPILNGVGLIIDALFGTGLKRPLEGPALAIVEAANAHAAPVLAVDIPSGINADTGAVMGAAIRAARTAALLAKKPAHVLFPGRAHAGAIDVIDIGAPAEALAEVNPHTVENAPAVWGRAFRRPAFGAHKYSRGHAAIVSGSRLNTGAARLAARGALRAGAGLVTVLSPADAAAENAAHLTAIMLREAEDALAIDDVLSDRRFTAALIGPGAGTGGATVEKVFAILKSRAAAVLDADIFTAFAPRPEALFAALRNHDVLTPHDGEFARLFKDIDTKALGKLEAARAASQRAGAVLVLKGADTVIAAPDGRASVNVNAPPDLATAGAGDVLGGFICGLLAQGMPAFEAACAGVWLHGACGQAGGSGLIAEDLPDLLPAVLRGLLDPPAPKAPGGD